ncbi:MAG: Uma2 family endonuclease [Acidobacteriia bacterium]|nr:Uma2 family endonuclease [Terriglobia bacterium]
MSTTALVTSEQYLALPDEFDRSGNRIKDELIGGEIVRMALPSNRHDRIKNLINQLLILYLASHQELGLESLVEMGAEVTKHDVFVPNVSVVKHDRQTSEARVFQGAPDLAIEVVSPSDSASHLKAKVDAYLKNGSQTVWVVYPDTRSVVVHSGDSAREFKADQKIEDPLLPDFFTPVSTFFNLT